MVGRGCGKMRKVVRRRTGSGGSAGCRSWAVSTTPIEKLCKYGKPTGRVSHIHTAFQQGTRLGSGAEPQDLFRLGTILFCKEKAERNADRQPKGYVSGSFRTREIKPNRSSVWVAVRRLPQSAQCQSMGQSSALRRKMLLKDLQTGQRMIKACRMRSGGLVGGCFIRIPLFSGNCKSFSEKRVDFFEFCDILLVQSKSLGIWLPCPFRPTGNSSAVRRDYFFLRNALLEYRPLAWRLTRSDSFFGMCLFEINCTFLLLTLILLPFTSVVW